MPHEYSLYGQVAESRQPLLLQQLAGICRMQPRPVEQVVLVFKARPPPGLADLPGPGEASGKADVQRIAKMLTSNIYFVKVVGTVNLNRKPASSDVQKSNGHSGRTDADRTINWHFEFKDIPDAGTGQATVNGRLLYRFDIEDNDLLTFMKQLGYESVNPYLWFTHRPNGDLVTSVVTF
jgi:hypothetical protein